MINYFSKRTMLRKDLYLHKTQVRTHRTDHRKETGRNPNLCFYYHSAAIEGMGMPVASFSVSGQTNYTPCSPYIKSFLHCYIYTSSRANIVIYLYSRTSPNDHLVQEGNPLLRAVFPRISYIIQYKKNSH